MYFAKYIFWDTACINKPNIAHARVSPSIFQGFNDFYVCLNKLSLSIGQLSMFHELTYHGTHLSNFWFMFIKAGCVLNWKCSYFAKYIASIIYGHVGCGEVQCAWYLNWGELNKAVNSCPGKILITYNV